MLLKLFSIIFPVFAIVLLGYLYARRKPVDMAAANELNMAIFTPCLIFNALAGSQVHLSTYVPLALAGAVIVLGSALLVWPLCRMLQVDPRTLVPVCAFTNTGNLMLPLALLMFGPAALPAVVVLFVVEMVAHLTVGIYILDRNTRFTGLLKMPIMIAVFLGVTASLMQVRLLPWLALPVKMLGDIAVPLMLVGLGIRLTEISFRDWRLGVWGAVLTPLSGLFLYLLVTQFMHFPRMEQGLLMVFAALPPAVMNYIVSESYGQEPEKVASLVLIGNLGSLVFLPLTIAFVLHG